MNNSSLLHGTLGQCVSSSEPIHLVEYILTEPEKPKPKRDNIMPHDDWIGSIDASIPLYTLTGCYDQHIRLWKHTRTTVSEETSGSSNGMESIYSS